MVVWRFRKDTRAPVLAAIEEEARRSSWEDVWRAELRLGCGRGGIVAGGGFFFVGIRGWGMRDGTKGSVALVADGWIIRRAARDGYRSSWLIRVQAPLLPRVSTAIRACWSESAETRQKVNNERVTYSRYQL